MSMISNRVERLAKRRTLYSKSRAPAPASRQRRYRYAPRLQIERAEGEVRVSPQGLRELRELFVKIAAAVGEQGGVGKIAEGRRVAGAAIDASVRITRAPLSARMLRAASALKNLILVRARLPAARNRARSAR
ncbi:MAG: hypothetical protein WDM79_07305 [Terricaulis sp.]